MNPAGVPAVDQLRYTLSRRGWTVTSFGPGLAAHKRDWPAAVRLLADPGDDGAPSMMGVMLDFRWLPLRGERFRDIFNSERVAVLRGMGEFRVRQLRQDSNWNQGISRRTFLGGAGQGIGRNAEVVLFDRCPRSRGQALVERLALDLMSLIEIGNGIGNLLQRTYPWSVLNREEPVPGLPEQLVGYDPSMQHVVVVGELSR
jgi:hypothetical protein